MFVEGDLFLFSKYIDYIKTNTKTHQQKYI